MHTLSSTTDKYNLDITIRLDFVPEEYDYNLILLDKHARLLGVGKPNPTGGKSITLPHWCLKDENYTLKVQTLTGTDIVSEESYQLSFRENSLHMEYLRMCETLHFNYVIRKKIWEKQTKHLEKEISAFQKQHCQEQYYKQLLFSLFHIISKV